MIRHLNLKKSLVKLKKEQPNTMTKTTIVEELAPLYKKESNLLKNKPMTKFLDLI